MYLNVYGKVWKTENISDVYRAVGKFNFVRHNGNAVRLISRGKVGLP